MITTRWKVQVKEYDRTGYYYPVYKTNVTVIANTKEKALQTALERVPKNSGRHDYIQSARVVSFEDIVISQELEE